MALSSHRIFLLTVFCCVTFTSCDSYFYGTTFPSKPPNIIYEIICSRINSIEISTYWEAVEQFQSCQTNITRTHSIEKRVLSKNVTFEESVKSYFEAICPILPHYILCLNDFSHASNICFEENEIKFKDVVIQILSRIGSYGCKDGGAKMAEFHALLPNCVIGKQDSFLTCLNVPTIHNFVKFFHESSIENFNMEISPELCSDYEVMQDCMKSLLNECEHRRTIEVAYDIFEIIRRLGSGNIIRQQRSVVFRNFIDDFSLVEFTKQIIEDFVKQTCSRNDDGENNFNTFVSGFTNFTKCFEDVYNYEYFQNRTVTTDEELREVLGKICHRVPDALQCIDQFSTVANVCLKNEEIELKNSLVRILNGVVNYGCTENGEIIMQFTSNASNACFDSTNPKIEECISALDVKNRTLGDVQNVLTITSEDCNYMINGERCAVDNLKTCEYKPPAIIAENVFRIILTEFSPICNAIV